MRAPMLLPAWLAAVALACSAAHAGTLQVKVTDADGNPAIDVVVLVEAPAPSAPKAAAAPVVIAQENLRFVPFLTVVPVGSVVRFVNRDSYDHHVRTGPSGPLGALPAAQSFELRLDAANPKAGDDAPASSRKKSGMTSADVKLEAAGPTGLGCHLHSSMRGQLYAAATPWFGKTDASGTASIDGVPDGAVTVKLWHPDQIQEQPPLLVPSVAGPTAVSGKLNFTPRRRRG